MSEVTANYDESWKEALNEYFESFLSFFFPNIHSLIDWNKTPVARDKEFQQLKADYPPDLQVADKLYQVWLINPKNSSILIHYEVQSQYETNFDKRLFLYNTRAINLQKNDAISLVILGDTRPSWRPTGFSFSYAGIGLSAQYGSFKLLDYESRWNELELSNNPFGIITMAHLKTAATTGNLVERAEWKWSIVQRIYEKGWSNRDIIKVFNIIDTLMTLPQPAQAEFSNKVKRLEEERKMPLISPTIQLAREEGEQRGEQKLVIQLLNHRIGEIEASLIEQIRKLSVEQVEELAVALLNFSTVANLEEWLKTRPKLVEQE